MIRHNQASVLLAGSFLVFAAACSSEPTPPAPRLDAATFTLAEHSEAGTAVGALSAIAGTGRSVTYAIASGNTGDAFALDPATGALTVADAAALDFETSPTFSLTVEATDDGSPPRTGSALVTVQLTDVNEAPVLSGGPFLLDENSAVGTLVGTLAVIDPDAAQTHAFELVDDAGPFAIDDEGRLTVADASALDFEATTGFTLTVRATDSGTPALFDETTVTVELVDVNEAPTLAGGPFQIPENTAESTLVGTMSVTDPDAGQTHTFSLAEPSPAFAIDPTSGAIAVTNPAALDFETTPQFTLTVRATDSGTPALFDEVTVTIALTDVNEAPVLSDATFSLPENSAPGTSVGTLSAADPDAGQALTLAIVAGNESGAFALDGTTLVVADASKLDFESVQAFSLTVEATDDATPPLSTTAVVSIQLLDVNEAPVLAGAAFQLPENSAQGTEVGTLVVVDQDAGQTHAFAITSGNESGAFALDGAKVVVADASKLDFETTPQFTLTVRATDSGTPALFGDATVTIALLDVNEAPVLADATFSVAENSWPGTSVGTLIAVDQDAGQALTLTIVAGNEAGAFALVGARLVVADDNSALDYETTTQLTLTVRVTDDGSPALFDEATITVQITDVNEAPRLWSDSLQIAENSLIGTVVGQLSATDPDAGQTLTYVLSEGNDGGTFAIDPGTGEITVASNELLDFETMSGFTLTVRVYDDGSPPLSDVWAFDVWVTDVNEAPVLAGATFQLAENSANGTAVGTLSVSDPDAGQTHTFSITGGNESGAFAIHPSLGRITVADASKLDFETTPVFTLQVKAVDDGADSLSGTATVTVTLTDVNEAPVVAARTFQINENSPAGMAIGSVVASDQDAGQTLTYAITQGNEHGTFAVDASTGQLRVAVASALDYETSPQFTITVRATDNGTPALSGSATITVNLVDVNDAPVLAALEVLVPSNAQVGETLDHVLATDEDRPAQTLTYEIESGSAGRQFFALEAATGRLYVAATEYEDGEAVRLADMGGQTVSLTVKATDDGAPPMSARNTVLVSIEQIEPPVAGTLELTTVPGTPRVAHLSDAVSLGAPAATVVHFGGGALGGQHAPGTSVSFAGGSVSVSADGTVSLTPTAAGRFAFDVRVQNKGGSADVAVVMDICVVLPVGGAVHLDSQAGADLCLQGGAEYVVVPQNRNLTNAADRSLTVTASNIVPVVGPPTPDLIPGDAGLLVEGAGVPPATLSHGAEEPELAHDFDLELRRREREELVGLQPVRGVRPDGLNLQITPGVPAVGDFMDLNVQANDSCGNLDVRKGRVMVVSDRAIIVDEWKADLSGPVIAGGLSQADFEEIAETFDDVIWPAIAGAFGDPTDLDGNGRVVIFYTTGVNALTPPGSSSVVGGFVFARDLYSAAPGSCPGSNEGEMFYMLSADPTGQVNGNVRTISYVKGQTVGTLAHEFQHLINASRRVYIHGSPGWEEVWLNEGLSHIAEELMFYEAAGMSPRANIIVTNLTSGPYASKRVAAFNTYANPNFGRLRSWLQNPHWAGPFTPNDDLATRGIIWAFLRYAADRKGGDESALWYALANTTLAGQQNLADRLGLTEETLSVWMADFLAAMYLDDAVPGAAAHHTNLSWNYRSLYTALYGSHQLKTTDLSDGVPFTQAYASGGSAAYLRLGVTWGQTGRVQLRSSGALPPPTTGMSVLRRK